MDQSWKSSDRVVWNSSRGPVHGRVERILTEPMAIGEHRVAASKDNAEVLVRSDRTGALAAHRPDALTEA